MSGVTVYEGPSVLDGEPIVCVATLRSANRKTGDMVQTWIMRADMSPVEALSKGADVSVCGSCSHRHSLQGACYVTPFQAPNSVWRQWRAGKYPAIATIRPRRLLAVFAGRALRLGSYGDPAALPFPVWKGLVSLAGSHTGYTHQFRHPAFDRRLLEYCMVSADTERQAEAYHRLGLRTFRVKLPEQPLLDGELYCPAGEGGQQCLSCMACSGGTAGLNIAIDVHGSLAVRYLPNRQNLIATDAA